MEQDPNSGRLRLSLKRASRILKVPGSWKTPRKKDNSSGTNGSQNTHAVAGQQRSNRAAAADLHPFQEVFGAGEGWARTEYGHYYVNSVSVYSAIKIRADAISRPPAVILHRTPEGALLPVEPLHPAQQLLDRVNPWSTAGDLWRATEIYLNLWGSAYWALDRDEEGRREIWPLRPDRVSILPDKRRYIRGFVYQGRNGPVAYTPEEIIWIRYFNPLEEYAGLSPVAPARLSVDMGNDAMRFNRNFLRNSAQPDFVLLTKQNRMPDIPARISPAPPEGTHYKRLTALAVGLLSQALSGRAGGC